MAVSIATAITAGTTITGPTTTAGITIAGIATAIAAIGIVTGADRMIDCRD